jgi:hypothetical protein
VKVERAAEAPLVYGDTLAADVRAKYLHGAAMVDARVSYTLRRSDTTFRPPGSENEPFSFGPTTQPWWWRGHGGFGAGKYGGRYGGRYGGETMIVKQGAGATDTSGNFAVSHLLSAKETPWGEKPPLPPADDEAPTGPPDPPSAATYTLEAQVVDQNRQAIAGRQDFVVHPADEYVGVRSDRSVYREGERARVEAIVADVTGKRVPGRAIEIALVRSETRRTAVEDKGRWSYKYETVDVPAGNCQLTSDVAPASCELEVGKAGTYVARAEIKDAKGRRALTRHTLYVYGKDAVVWDQDQRRVDLVPDRRSYEPGEKATVLLRSPFERARGLAVIEREGIVEYRELVIEGGAGTLEIPLTEENIPGVEVAVLLIRGRVEVPGAPPDQDLGRPAVAVGTVSLAVASTRKKIDLRLITERSEVAPKETLKLEIQARDPAGAGQKAAVAIMVVDEGVLSLMSYKTPDPLAFFHRTRTPGVSLFDLRQYLLARSEEDTLKPERGNGVHGEKNGHFQDDSGAPGFGGARGGAVAEGMVAMPTAAPRPAAARPMEESEAKPDAKKRARTASADAIDANMAMRQPISLRTLFATTAYFNPEVVVGPTGLATIEIPMPENLTSFRVMAVAVDPDRPDHFGSAETQVKVRKPIMLRPSLPRFANFGDSFQASVMVDNQTDKPQAIVVGTRGSNVVLPGETTKPIEVPAGQSQEVRFPMAVDRVGTMRLQFAALSNGGRDATEISLRCCTPRPARPSPTTASPTPACCGPSRSPRACCRPSAASRSASARPRSTASRTPSASSSVTATSAPSSWRAGCCRSSCSARCSSSSRSRRSRTSPPASSWRPRASPACSRARTTTAGSASGTTRIAAGRTSRRGPPSRCSRAKRPASPSTSRRSPARPPTSRTSCATARRPRGVTTTTTPAAPSRCGCSAARVAGRTCSTACTPGATRSRCTPART